MKTITAQVIRDRLGFKGPLSVRGLEIELGMPYGQFAKALDNAIERGLIGRAKVEALGDVESLEVFYTSWVDDTKLAADIDKLLEVGKFLTKT